MHRIYSEIVVTAKESATVAVSLFQILIPAVIIVKILQETGTISLLARFLTPAMHLFGLPGEMAIVWATAMLTNIYGGIAVFMLIGAEVELSTADITVLSTMILICHSLPVELALTRRAGAPISLMAPLRIGGAVVAGWLLHLIYTAGGWLQDDPVIVWSPSPQSNSLLQWAIDQLYQCGIILTVLFCLLLLMKLFHKSGITGRLQTLLKPLLRTMGISEKAASIAVFGLLAGITFGSGLLLAEVKENKIPAADVILVLAFLSLCHGVVEDTMLMLLLGANLSGILFFRFIFAFICIALLARISLPRVASCQ